MRESPGKNPDQALAAWFHSPMGRAVLACEHRVVSKLADAVFGGHLLQLGHWPDGGFLSHCRVQQRIKVAEEGPCDIQCGLDALPVASGSIDVVFIPHALAFSSSPHGIIREADRVLARGGYLVLLGFSPFSLWGLRAMLRRPPFQHARQLLTERRIGDWMELLGLELLRIDRYLYRFPVPQGAVVRRTRFLENWGHSLIPGPWPAAGYAVLFQKRDVGGNVIRPEWRRRRQKIRQPAALTDGYQGQRRSRSL